MLARLLAAAAFCVFAVPATAQETLGEAEVFVAGDLDGDHAAGHEAHEEGLPVTPRADLALWSGIVFLLFLGTLTLLAWKPATKGLDAREDRIRGDLAAAERHRLDSERLMKQHSAEMAKAQDSVKEILAEARRDAEVAKANILAEADAAAKAREHRAVTEIARAKDQALAELFDTYNDRVAAATETVLGRGLTDADQRRLIDEAVADFRGSKA